MSLMIALALWAHPALAQDPAPDEVVTEEEPEEAPAEATAEEAPPEPGLYTATLDNGLTVSVLSDFDLPVVATQTWVQVGSAHEADDEAGFAHLFEHLMFGATERHDKEAYSRHHTTVGGSENAWTSFDNTVYISEIGPAWHDEVLALEADRLSGLVLDADNLANEQKIVTEELRLRTENNPFARLLNPALAAIFGEHPYGHSPAGTKEDIAGADLELVRKFYAGYYHPANLHLVVVGPVDGPATITRIEALYGEVDKQRLEPPEVQPLATWTFPERVVLKEDIPPVKFAAAVYMGPTRGDEDYWAWKVMTEMLAGGELDRFREELVTERGKAMEAATIAEELRAGGILAFGSVSLPFRSQRRAFKLMSDSLTALDDGDWLSPEVLATAKRRMLKAELERSYSAAGTANAIGEAWSWQGDASLALGGATEAIDAVTLEEVRAAWDTYVVQADPVEVFIKKGKAQLPDDGGDQ